MTATMSPEELRLKCAQTMKPPHDPGCLMPNYSCLCGPNYSRSYDAAFELVEALRKAGWHFAATNFSDLWQVDLWRNDSEPVFYSTNANLLIAICEGFLRANEFDHPIRRRHRPAPRA